MFIDSMKKKIRILHIDDEPVDLEITRIFLNRISKDNFDIKSVLSAEEALTKLESDHFDVVIADYQMPEMDGIEFLNALRRSKNDTIRQIPFILFTGKGGVEVAEKALSKGANRYIAKDGGIKKQCNELVSAIQECTRDKL